MPALLRDRLLLVWALLVGVTLFSAGIGGGASWFGTPGMVAVAVLAIAFIKAGMVMFTFMEIGRAPIALRFLAAGWLVAALAVLLAIYARILA
jgi:hypothetical protein